MKREIIRGFNNVSGQAIVEVVELEKRKAFLTIAGDTVFNLGFTGCDTCSFFLEKVYPAESISEGVPATKIASIADALRDVQAMLPMEILKEIGSIFSTGLYDVALIKLVPELVLPGAKEDYFSNEVVGTWGLDPFFGVATTPKTPYYRLGSKSIGPVEYGGLELGVVIGIPLYPPKEATLNSKVVESYESIF